MSRLSETTALITEMRRRPLLWDTTSADYKDKTKRMEAWREIARELYPHLSDNSVRPKKIRELNSRWKNIRDSYSKHLKRVLTSGSSGPKHKPYIFAPKLSFLNKFMTFKDFDPSDNAANENSITESQLEQQQEEGEEDWEETVGNEEGVCTSPTLEYQGEESNEIFAVKPEPEFPIDSPDLDIEASETTFNHSTSSGRLRPSIAPPARHERGLQSPSESSWWTMEKMTRRFLEREMRLREERDPDMAFFTSLLPTLRAFTEDQKLEFRTEVLLAVRAVKSGTGKTAAGAAAFSST